ncbi:MAG: hypothetical protein JWO48_3520 [Bryobacterales bacterium]|nr:hypothetical protein [Bryobacterales bacterium]
MSAKVPQTFANHVRFDLPYHAFLVPVAGINVLVAIWNVFRNPSLAAAWFVILAIAAVVAVLKLRLYPLKAQDRIIRLEEQLRLFQLLPQGLRGRCGELSEAQLIALRFAADADVPALMEKVLGGSMSQREIKRAIVNWRPDYYRV